MKLVSYALDRRMEPRLAWLQGDLVVDSMRAALWLNQDRQVREFLQLPTTLKRALADWPANLAMLQRMRDLLQNVSLPGLQANERPIAQVRDDVVLFPPVPNPPSFRDFYAFEQHVRSARARRNLEMIPEWYKFPVFYFSNPNSLLGDGWELFSPPDTEELDFELEIACILAGEGQGIRAESAAPHIAGYTVLNDWSARDLQREEMKVGLGPARGKDFATSLGPCLVTADEFSALTVDKGCNVEMIARRNGKEISRGNWKDIHYSFAEMIERASRGTVLLPGDILGSGTVGSGCILELGPENCGGWLQPGDELDLEIQGIGTLRNPILTAQERN